jgi:PAS domain S-box-containing protein
VLVLVDIDAMKSANEQLKKSTEFFRGIINTVRQPLVVLDSTFRIMAVNESFLQTFSTSSEQIVNKFLYRIANEQWNIIRLRVLLEELLPKQQAVTNFEVQQEFETIGRKTMLLNARALFQANGQEPMILLAIEDITERQRAEEELRKSHDELQSHAEELSRFNRSAVGRELRMIELKKEVNELCGRHGEPARYPLEFEQDGKEPHIETSETSPK